MKDWGNTMYASEQNIAGIIARGPDRRSTLAAAWMSWGAATGAQDIFEASYKYFKEVIGTIQADGHISSVISKRWTSTVPAQNRLRYTNMVIGYAVMAAETAENMNVPDYELKNARGQNLRDAIRWLLSSAMDENHTANSPDNQDLTFAYRVKSTGAMNISWAEAYRARFPNDKINELIVHFLEETNSSYYSSAGAYGAHYGGYTTCFFKPVKEIIAY